MKTNKWSVFVALFVTVISMFQSFITKSVAEEEVWTVSLSTDFVNQYVGFDNGAVFYDKPMFQSDIFFSHKSGFHADIWWGTGLNDDLTRSGFDDEIDYNVGFANAVPFTGEKMRFDAGIGYWDMFGLFKGGGFDMIHPFIEINYPVTVFGDRVKLTPFIKWQTYLPFETSLDEGTMTSAGCRYRINLGKKLAVTGLTSFGYDDGGFGFQPGVIWKDYLNLEWRLGKSLTWRVIESQFYVPVNVNDRDPEQVFGTGFTWSFK